MSDANLQMVTELPKLDPRRADGHKGNYGRVLVVAGSRGMSGAAVLSGSAALRAGAGLVKVAGPHEIQTPRRAPRRSSVRARNACSPSLAAPHR